MPWALPIRWPVVPGSGGPAWSSLLGTTLGPLFSPHPAEVRRTWEDSILSAHQGPGTQRGLS